jgi:hypothetical protein
VNRQQEISQVLLWEAAAKKCKARADAARQRLDEEARAELAEQGTAPTWRLPDIGSVTLPLSQETVYVADEKALLEWCKSTPGESVVETVERVMPWYVADLLRCYARVVDGQVVDEDGEVIPGLGVRPGGVPLALSFRPSHEAKAYAGDLADRVLSEVEQHIGGGT